MLNWFKKDKKQVNLNETDKRLSDSSNNYFVKNDSISHMLKNSKNISKMGDTYLKSKYKEEQEETEFNNDRILDALNNTNDNVEYLSKQSNSSFSKNLKQI